MVFVGKSLTARGGQNPIEPAALGKAMVFGPHMQNFRAVVRGFVESDAATQVADAEELETALTRLLMSPEKRNSQGARARAVVEANQGATRRTAEITARMLSHLPFSAAR
mgnify:FL=1